MLLLQALSNDLLMPAMTDLGIESTTSCGITVLYAARRDQGSAVKRYSSSFAGVLTFGDNGTLIYEAAMRKLCQLDPFNHSMQHIENLPQLRAALRNITLPGLQASTSAARAQYHLMCTSPRALALQL